MDEEVNLIVLSQQLKEQITSSTWALADLAIQYSMNQEGKLDKKLLKDFCYNINTSFREINKLVSMRLSFSKEFIDQFPQIGMNFYYLADNTDDPKATIELANDQNLNIDSLVKQLRNQGKKIKPKNITVYKGRVISINTNKDLGIKDYYSLDLKDGNTIDPQKILENYKDSPEVRISIKDLSKKSEEENGNSDPLGN